MLKEIKDRKALLSKLKDDHNLIFRNSLRDGLVYGGKTGINTKSSLEEDIANQFACGIIPNKRFMSYGQLLNIYNKLSKKRETGANAEKNKKFYKNTISSQPKNIIAYYDEYIKVIDEYEKNKESKKAKTAMHDLYIKMKYEDSVISIGKELAKTIKLTDDVDKNKKVFLEKLRKNEKYLEVEDAYEKLGTDQARKDLIPELYIKSRLANPKLLKIANPEWKDLIIKKERKFAEKYAEQKNGKMSSDEMYRKGISENQDHAYSWGVILRKPTDVMQNVLVNNSDFQGTMSIKHLGFFSSESLFRKRKLLREKFEKTKFFHGKVKLGRKRYKLGFKEHKANPNIPEFMREYYYRNVSTKQLYNNIYKVSKIDNNGIKREDIVFSPIGMEEFEYVFPDGFLENIYFSNYNLDIAKENGGFAGEIIDSSKGLSISTRYNEDEIASCVLFQNDTMGRLIKINDNGEKNFIDIRSSKILESLENRSRERTR